MRPSSLPNPAVTELLRQAAEVLSVNAYQVRVEEEVLLAENDLFVLGIAGSPQLESLPLAESTVQSVLSRALLEDTVGSKVWDVYCVLLCPDHLVGDDSTLQIFELTYNTRSMRRIVRLGVAPTYEDVERALRPFLPLHPPSSERRYDALSELRNALISNGVEEQVALGLLGTARSSDLSQGEETT